MLLLKRGLENGYSFFLATEMTIAVKFDDIVFKHECNGKEVLWRFLQAKHRRDESTGISLNNLLKEKDGDFNIQKSNISYCKIKQKPEIQACALQDFTICTKIDFDNEARNIFERAVRKRIV